MDVIIRTKNSDQYIGKCLESVFREIPVRRVIIVDAGSTDRTLEITSSFENVDIYVKPELNIGQATKYGFTIAKTEWIVCIDSDIVLRKGWFDGMKQYMNNADAVEGGRIDHYNFNVKLDTSKIWHGRISQTILKRKPVLDFDLDVPFGEDTIMKINFEKMGKKWKKVPNFLADHYFTIDNMTHRRTGTIFRPEPHSIYIPKKYQIEEGHIARKYNTVTKKQAIKRLVVVPIYEAYWSFKKSFWFCMAYFKLI
jgi:glycosyltransferase involved in cell wall biosynthesis